MKHIIFTLLLIGTGLNSQAQSASATIESRPHEEGAIYNEAIYISLAPLSQMIAYEHRIGRNRRVDFRVKIAAGHMLGLLGGENVQTHAQLSMLTGKTRKHHFELSAGPLLDFSYDSYYNMKRSPESYSSRTLGSYLYWYPSFYYGYRFQKPDERFLFRVGIGYPELLAASVGYAF